MRLTRLVVNKKSHKKRIKPRKILSQDFPQKSSLLLLDQFSQEDLRTWKRMADGLDQYYIRLYYHFEGLRIVHEKALCEALTKARPTAIKLDDWVRIVDFKYSLMPLSAKGSMVNGGRFNIGEDLNPSQIPPFPALYIAENYKTAYAEKFGASESVDANGLSGNELALRKNVSFTSVSLSGRFENLFDISKTANLREFIKIIKQFEFPVELKAMAKTLGIKPPYKVTDALLLKQSLLLNEWRAWPIQFQIPANSQIFGRLIMEAGFEGIIYPSVQGRGKCIAIFPSNLTDSSSFVELANESPAELEFTRLDSGTWERLVQ